MRICTEKMLVLCASVICLDVMNYHRNLSSFFSTAMLFLSCFLFILNGKRHQVKVTKQNKCEDDKMK